MGVTFQIQGAQEARRELLELHDRLHQPMTPLLEAMGQQVASWIQGRIADDGADLRGTPFAWPEHHPATKAIRRRYGHEGKPRLYRGGQLQHSIRPLEQGSDYVDVGTNLEGAATVHHGGETSRGGRRRTVQAFPFVVLIDQQIDDLAEIVGIYFTEPESSPGEVRRA